FAGGAGAGTFAACLSGEEGTGAGAGVRASSRSRPSRPVSAAMSSRSSRIFDTFSKPSPAEASGLRTKSNAPDCRARMVSLMPSSLTADIRMTGVGRAAMISRSASMPFIFGISRSITTTSGASSRVSRRASSPSPATPAISNRPDEVIRSPNTLRMKGESSTSRTRYLSMFAPPLLLLGGEIRGSSPNPSDAAQKTANARRRGRPLFHEETGSDAVDAFGRRTVGIGVQQRNLLLDGLGHMLVVGNVPERQDVQAEKPRRHPPEMIRRLDAFPFVGHPVDDQAEPDRFASGAHHFDQRVGVRDGGGLRSGHDDGFFCRRDEPRCFL